MKAKIITTAILSISTAIYNIINPVSALEYTANYGNNFTIRPSISVSLSAADLIINDLTPGNSQDSNEIIVNVESNNISGYVLNSSVGSSANPYSTYGRNLTNTTSSSYAFTSLNYGDSKESLTDPNTWGYSYSDQTVTTPTWSSYSGLPLYSDTTNIATLKSSTTPSSANGDNIGFKIAAKASNTQGSGEYTNIINFIAVANPTPTSFYDAFANAASQPGSTISQLNGYYKMQDMTPDICEAVEIEENQISLIDSRDNNVYTVAKLKDDRCWMTSNLNLKGGTALDANNTNVDASYISSFVASNNLAKDGNAIVLPASSTSGFNTSNYSYVYNSGNITDNQADCTDTRPCNSYYSWDAATLGSGRGISTDDTDAPYSICPKGWHLPNTRTGTDDTSDFRALMIGYGGSAEVATYSTSTSPTGAQMYASIGPDSIIPNFLRTGYYESGQFVSGGSRGYYWSATSGGSTYANRLNFASNRVYSAAGSARLGGHSVRCVANNE